METIIEKLREKRKEIVEQCESCGQIMDGKYCHASVDPSAKWRNGKCNLATHIIIQETRNKKQLNPIKKSKRR